MYNKEFENDVCKIIKESFIFFEYNTEDFRNFLDYKFQNIYLNYTNVIENAILDWTCKKGSILLFYRNYKKLYYISKEFYIKDFYKNGF